jgi:hypothetical protein
VGGDSPICPQKDRQDRFLLKPCANKSCAWYKENDTGSLIFTFDELTIQMDENRPPSLSRGTRILKLLASDESYGANIDWLSNWQLVQVEDIYHGLTSE